MTTAPLRQVRVVAAVIEHEGKLLLSRRKDKGERAGLWEFPGGKIEAGETEEAALVRELREELDVEATVGAFVERLTHEYPDVRVELILYRATVPLGAEPKALSAAEVAWVPKPRLLELPFCEADIPILGRIARE
ncbi:MAG: (deoxy)nucleoside triphosphate pyrophosphohydrolase [Deltaproteobacteria bacterium]|nr:(deoxy)nucleoside triphosphate pyrophosphohydrolase [Deltaproteobacteria bacterium]